MRIRLEDLADQEHPQIRGTGSTACRSATTGWGGQNERRVIREGRKKQNKHEKRNRGGKTVLKKLITI